MAQDLARSSSKYSTQEILERSLDITVGAAKRLQVKKVSAWQVAMTEEKELMAHSVRQPIVGKGVYGRKGFDGRYAQHVSEAYRDPEKRAHYQERAKEINADKGGLSEISTKDAKTYVEAVNELPHRAQLQ